MEENFEVMLKKEIKNPFCLSSMLLYFGSTLVVSALAWKACCCMELKPEGRKGLLWSLKNTV